MGRECGLLQHSLTGAVSRRWSVTATKTSEGWTRTVYGGDADAAEMLALLSTLSALRNPCVLVRA